MAEVTTTTYMQEIKREQNLEMQAKYVRYFNRQKNSQNPIFLNRFPNLVFKGKTVLDLGCGQGAMAIDLAERGAGKVIAVDIEPDRVEFAHQNMQQLYPEYADVIEFSCSDFRDLENDQFDIIISKASFEHFIDLEVMIENMRDKLKVGGQLAAGFGPLYNSPWGDHNRLKHALPWMHVLFPEEYFIKKLNDAEIKNIHDLGLNGYSRKKYEQIFSSVEDFDLVDYRINVSDKISMKIFSLFAHIPFLREYFTYNIYCVLQRSK